jgi:hypothetical protein
MVAVWFPERLDLLEVVYLGMMVALAVGTGAFALYVLFQQLRNPGRSPRSR